MPAITDRHDSVAGGPRIARDLTLHLQGDWGLANLHRICSWLAQELTDRAGPGTRVAIWTGRGGTDAAHAVVERRVDAALMVPAAFASMAVAGVGCFAGTPMPELRALATLPQRDRLVLAVGAEHGIASFADLRARRPALRIATSPDDGVNTVGWAVRAALRAHGVDPADLVDWGGTFLEDERPFLPQAWLRDGVADAIFHEAIMTPGWREAGEARPLAYVPMEPEALDTLRREFAWPSAVVPRGYLPGLAADLVTADFSDFVLLCRSELPDDVAYLLAWCVQETRRNLERQYEHIPAERSPVTYPLDPVALATTSIELHPGARRCYEDLGVL